MKFFKSLYHSNKLNFSGEIIESETAKSDGTPHMKMFKVREVKRYQIEIITFAQIGNILRLAGTPEKKFAETRACLECKHS